MDDMAKIGYMAIQCSLIGDQCCLESLFVGFLANPGPKNWELHRPRAAFGRAGDLQPLAASRKVSQEALVAERGESKRSKRVLQFMIHWSPVKIKNPRMQDSMDILMYIL